MALGRAKKELVKVYLVIASVALLVGFGRAQGSPSHTHTASTRNDTKVREHFHDPGLAAPHHTASAPVPPTTNHSQDELMRTERRAVATQTPHASTKPPKVATLKEPPKHSENTNFHYQPPKQTTVQGNHISNRPHSTTPH
jgi:hypothetical protein